MLAPATTASPPKPRSIPHLEGLRFVCAIWVVYAHLISDPRVTVSNRLAERASVAMTVFFVLSGFVTHLSSATLDLTSMRAYWLWFYRRSAVLLATTYVSVACALVLQLFCDCGTFPVFQFFRCMLFVEELSLVFLQNERDFCEGAYGYCPSGLTWTVASFLFLWLLYPLVARAFAIGERKCGVGAGVLLPAGMVWAALLAVHLALAVASGHGQLPAKTPEVAYYLGVMWLGDFVVGVAVAAALNAGAAGTRAASEASPLLYAGEEAADAAASNRCGHWLRGASADTCVVIVVVGACALPSDVLIPEMLWRAWTPPDVLSDDATPCLRCWQTWCHALAPLVGAYIFLSREGGGLVSRLLSQPILVSLGGSSMAIYLFHRVWAVAFTFVLGYRAEMIANHELNKPASLQHWQIFLPYLLSLLLLCGLWHHAVEVPLSAAVRRWCATCAEGGDEKQPPRPRSSGTANLESGTRTSSHEGQGERARR